MKSTKPASRILSVLSLIALSIGGSLMTSCRTTEGFGRDLQKVGAQIENEAEKRG